MSDIDSRDGIPSEGPTCKEHLTCFIFGKWILYTF